MDDALLIPESGAEEFQSQEETLIPEGRTLLWVVDVELRGPYTKKNIRNIKDSASFYVLDAQLCDVNDTGKIIPLHIAGRNNSGIYIDARSRKNYVRFCEATQCAKVPHSVSGYTKYYPTNRWNDDTAPGAVGMPVYAFIVHEEIPVRRPVRDEDGNVVLDENGRWVWETVKDEAGNIVKKKVERIAVDSDNVILLEPAPDVEQRWTLDDLINASENYADEEVDF